MSSSDHFPLKYWIKNEWIFSKYNVRTLFFPCWTIMLISTLSDIHNNKRESQEMRSSYIAACFIFSLSLSRSEHGKQTPLYTFYVCMFSLFSTLFSHHFLPFIFGAHHFHFEFISYSVYVCWINGKCYHCHMLFIWMILILTIKIFLFITYKCENYFLQFESSNFYNWK